MRVEKKVWVVPHSRQLISAHVRTLTEIAGDSLRASQR
jgi:hypothetical protein